MPPLPNPSLNLTSIDRLIGRQRRQLKKAGVLTARPGWEIAGGQITGRPAIVVSVERKKKRLPAGQRLPDEIQGVPVDVRPASPLTQLRLTNPTAYAVAKLRVPPEKRPPEHPLERRVSDGRRLTSLKPGKNPALKQDAAKTQIPYTPAAPALNSVTRRMTIIACASPDAGFSVLADFLGAVRKSLTVGLYDFTSAKLLEVMTTLLKKNSPQFRMVLDHPGVNPTANQTDDDTVRALQQAEATAQITHALTRCDPWTSAWIYNDYHIKVAVRDSDSFWLSSGNWNVSNQPDFATGSANDGRYQDADRDWHVVIMDAGLAQLFEAAIEHDYTVAAAHQVTPNAKVQQAIAEAMATLAKFAAKPGTEQNETPRIPFNLGKPRTFHSVPVTVQPLLTPDPGEATTMYVEHVLALITSAKKTLYAQMQYFEPSNLPGDSNFMRLLNAVRDAVQRGVDVRLIASQYESSHLEQMHDLGLTQVLRIQQRVHNKGIIVDSAQVLVSSQNWSAAGTLRNRDAGVILQHAGIAKFFEAIFLEDWDHRSTPAQAAPPNPGAASGH